MGALVYDDEPTRSTHPVRDTVARAMNEAIRIAVLNFVHETVTFLPNDTTLDDFVYAGSPARGEALLTWEPRSYMGGFVKVAREHAGVELVGIELPYRNVDISKFYPYGDVSLPDTRPFQQRSRPC